MSESLPTRKEKRKKTQTQFTAWALISEISITSKMCPVHSVDITHCQLETWIKFSVPLENHGNLHSRTHVGIKSNRSSQPFTWSFQELNFTRWMHFYFCWDSIYVSWGCFPQPTQCITLNYTSLLLLNCTIHTSSSGILFFMPTFSSHFRKMLQWGISFCNYLVWYYFSWLQASFCIKTSQNISGIFYSDAI